VETLKVVRKTFTMLSEKRTQVLDITKQIRDIVLGADIKEGIILVNSLHTTCALFVNEFQGALAEDLKTMMDRLVADGAGYKHDDPTLQCYRGPNTPMWLDLTCIHPNPTGHAKIAEYVLSIVDG